MNNFTHGLTIGIETAGADIFLSLKAVGKLTHEDYQTITPLLDAALESVKQPQLRLLIDGTELEGREPRAARDDFRPGLKHGNKNWQQITARVGSWFISDEVRYFEDMQEALAWLQA